MTLPCKYDSRYHGTCHICWMRGDIPSRGCGKEIIGSDGDKVVRKKSAKYDLVGQIQHGDVSLTIFSIDKTDTGKYGCRVHVPGWFNDEMHYVHLIVDDDNKTKKEISSTFSSSHVPRSSTTGMWLSNTTSEPSVSVMYRGSSSVESKDDVNVSAVLVPVLLLLLALIVIAVALIWKQKKKTRASLEVRRTSEISVIYSNSGSSVGLYNREMVVENVYQIQTESEYEQWH